MKPLLKKGDLVISIKGNLGIIVGGQWGINDQHVDIVWCSTGVLRTGLHIGNIRKINLFS